MCVFQDKNVSKSNLSNFLSNFNALQKKKVFFWLFIRVLLLGRFLFPLLVFFFFFVRDLLMVFSKNMFFESKMSCVCLGRGGGGRQNLKFKILFFSEQTLFF